jgi:hypothetical protein
MRSRALGPVALGLLLSGCRSCQEETPGSGPSAAPGPGSSVPGPSSSVPGAVPVPVPPVESGAPLKVAVDQARQSGGRPYRAPTDAELLEYSTWVTAVATAAITGELPTAAPPRGFVGRTAEGGRYWLVAERDEDKRGAGLLVLRLGRARPFLVEAPHTDFDRGTLELALLALDRLEARALLINTMPRSAKESAEERAEDAKSGESPSDVAHAKASFFSSAHRALAAVDPELVAVQLHGFRDDRAPGAEVVISAAGTRGNARAVASALRSVLSPTGVFLYPDDTRDLGATKNAQAALSRASHSAFIHVELSATLRGRLARDSALAGRTMEALGAAAGGTRR